MKKGYRKPKSKEKLLAELRAKKLRARLIAEGKLTEESEQLSELELKLIEKGNLDGKAVTIDMTDYNFRIKKGKLSKKFMDWLEENSEKQFTAIKEDEIMYRLEDVEPWRFSVFDLKLVEE